MSAPDPTPEPALRGSKVSMRELLEAGIHFGHQTRRWHPNMKPFLYGERNGVHIIDLQQTLPRLRAACDFAREVVASGGALLFVGTKRQAQVIVAQQAQRCSMPYVHKRWLGGMLTNFRTIQKGIQRYQELTELLQDEENEEGLSKKERSRLVREHLKLDKAFEGMVAMERLPDAIFVIDIKKEFIAVREAQRLQIPILAVVDSNCDPDGIDFTVPGNDDALRAISLYCEKLADACLEGAELFNRRIIEEDRRKPEEVDAAAEAPKHGKRVVEITQPARRPARMERMAEERRKELETPEPAPAGAATKSAEPAVEATKSAEPAAGAATKSAEPVEATESAEPAAGAATESAEPAVEATESAEPKGGEGAKEGGSA